MSVDWSSLPVPQDDGGARHLPGRRVPAAPLISTAGEHVDLSSLAGTTVVYVYPMTQRPDMPSPDGWEMIPGARGCTPQSCSFRDHFDDLRQAGVQNLFGLSTQSTEYQAEAAARLHLPFALLSDADLKFGTALELPVLAVSGMTLFKRLTMILEDGIITKVFYPVFPPDRNASDVAAWLREAPRRQR